MRNRLINDATSLVKQPPGQSRYRMVVLRRAQYRQPAESATVNPYGGRTEAAAPDAERMRKRGTPQEECPLFLQEVLPDYYYPLELKHPEQYTRPDI